MGAPTPSPTLVRGLLDGLHVVVAGGDARVLGAACDGAGARVHVLAGDLLDEEALAATVAELPGADLLVCDTGALLRAGGGGAAALTGAMSATWNATRAVLTGRLEPEASGMIVLLTPRRRDGAQAGAAAAALENLARTTSVEWARLGVRVVTVRPRDVTPDAAVSDLLAYLAAPAGAYFSGCVLDLGAAGLTGYSSASS